MSSYLENVSKWCGNDLGIGIGANSMRAWIEWSFNQVSDGPWLTIAGGKLVMRASPLTPDQTKDIVEVISAEGAPPKVRLNSFNFGAYVTSLKSLRTIESFSIGWRSLDASVVEDGGRAGRLRFEYLAMTGPAPTRFDKSPDFDSLLAESGLSLAEYEAAIRDMIAHAATPAFATVMLRQLAFPDYRAYLAGIQMAVGVTLTTLGGKVWIKGTPRIDVSELSVRSDVKPVNALDGDRPKRAAPAAFVDPIQDHEAYSHPVNIYLPGSALLAAMQAVLPATVSRLKTSWLNLVPTQGMADIQIRRESLSFHSGYGDAGADPETWQVKVRYTAFGKAHASQFELCSEQSPVTSTYSADTGEATLYASVSQLETGRPVLAYRVQAPAYTSKFVPATTPLTNCGLISQLDIAMWEVFELTAAATNLPWLKVLSLPGHAPGEELAVVSAPNGLVLTKFY